MTSSRPLAGRRSSAALLATMLVLSGHDARAQQGAGCSDVAGTVVSIDGLMSIDGSVAALDQPICSGAVVSVGADSRGGIRLTRTRSVVRIDSDTEFVIDPSGADASVIDLLKGIVYLFTRTRDRFRIETPYMNAAIDGTEFIVAVRDYRARITLIEGVVRVANDRGEVLLVGGESAVAGAARAPVRREVISPFDAVQWALHYPRPGAGEAMSAATREATELLASGKRSAASRVLARAVADDPSDAVALALQSIIASVLGERGDAATLARRAVDAGPDSSVVWTALSYARQADYRLESAARTAARAVELAPADAAAWARLAELQVITGQLDRARDSVARATELEPELSRTQSVTGFIRLARGEVGEALTAFRRAIGNDSEDPLARLGAGLARIRQNDLAGGRAEIEVAAILDPVNSLIRSYLGMAYLSENRPGLVDGQLDLAIALDANDPTPWLYAAILSQSMNRPVEALVRLRQSIARNGNRSVYRSRLDLDADLSSRQTRQGAIYNELGFEQAALLEGWKSLAQTPGNFAVHRLLADSYLGLPRHQFARDSELLQSQMLQPINRVPVQPNLSVGDLSLSIDTAQDRVGLNEFGRLFTQSGTGLRLGITGGGNDTLSAEAILSGLSERLSYSLGASSYRTDGLRQNNDSHQDTANLFVQYAPRPDTSVQLELRSDSKDEGDRQLLFDPDYIFPTLRNTNELTSFRIGLSHEFTPHQRLLATYSDASVRTTLFDVDEEGLPFIDYELEDDFGILELRYLLELDRINLNGGISSTRGDTLQGGLFAAEPVSGSRIDVNNRLAYAYLDVKTSGSLTMTAGASHVEFENSRADFSQLNPKLGILWDVAAATTLRAAYARNVKRPYFASQTLEPVSVAGFNQFFNDPDGSIADRAGVGVDHRIDDRLAFGAEYSIRELEIPSSLNEPSFEEDERLSRAYAHWTPARRLAVSLELNHENFDLDVQRGASEQFSDMTLWRVPLSVRYFHPGGLYTRATATWVRQEGRFNTNDGFDTPQESRFGVLDLGIGYRLPDRLGVLSLDVRNLFDETFRFQNSGRQELADDIVSTIAYDRQIFFNAVVNF